MLFIREFIINKMKKEINSNDNDLNNETKSTNDKSLNDDELLKNISKSSFKFNKNEKLKLEDFCSKSQSKESFLDLKIIPLLKLKLSAFPNLLTSKDLIRNDLTYMSDYKVKDFGIVCTNQDIVSNQSGIFKEAAVQLAKSLFKTGSFISLSLPIRIFEERSMLEKYCSWWINAPLLLKPAGETKDSVTALKYTITFYLSSLHHSASQLKPFNPILGESLQVSLDDGSKIYLEHTSHHPCVSNFYVVDKDKNYNISGYYDMQVEGMMKMIYTNYIYIIHKGKNSVYLKGTNKTIDVQIPKIILGGIAYGERYVLWDNYMKLEDRSSNLKVIIQFNLKGKKVHEIYGEIFKHDYSKEKKKDFFESFSKSPFPTDRTLVISTITGSYLENICFNGETFLEVNSIKLSNVNHDSNDQCYILPSDARYREDINWLTKSFQVKENSNELKLMFDNFAQEWKLGLEAQQRHDKKLRESKKKSKWSFY